MLDPDISTADALRHLQLTEHDRHAIDRRRFLQLVGLGVGAGALAGPASSLLDLSLPGLDPSVWAAGPAGPNDGVLVVLGMFGGNDGLNTVVPVNDQLYYGQHRGLAIQPQHTLRIDADTGLNPDLTSLKRFWDSGQLAIVEGVGYPNPDLSHFNSMAKWMAGAPTGVPTSGWVGRWLDGHLGGGKDLYAAVEVGQSVPLHLVGQAQRGTAVPAGRPSFGASTNAGDRKLYTGLRRLAAGDPGTWTGRIGEAMTDQLDLAATLTPLIPDELSDTPLVAEMEVMARLINANLGLRVVSAGWGDFDSHAGQPSQHPNRMSELNAAIERFFAVLAPSWQSRVTVMTYSEFGRTSWSNDGAGTDHGTAAPHFVFGANVRGGRYGQRPSLAGLGRWDRMPFHVDFRDYYGSLIDGWLGGGASDVLGGRQIADLGLFARAPGGSASTPTLPPVTVPTRPPSGGAGPGAVGDLVAITPRRIRDTRDGTGGPRGPIKRGQTMAVRVTGRGGVPETGVIAAAINVTSVNPTHRGFFSVFPTDRPTTGSSVLNPIPGRAAPNMAIVPVGADGSIGVYNHNGSTDCVVDVLGYVTAGAATRLSPLLPDRLLDTRAGVGVRRGRVRGGSTFELKIAGRGGVPPTGADSVLLNVGAVDPSERGYISMWPTGLDRPVMSNLNYLPGRNIANLVLCKLGARGAVNVYAHRGELDVIADVVGWFGATGSRLYPVSQKRLLDTRIGLGARRGPVGAGSEIDLAVAGVSGIAPGAKAVVLNMTATNAQSRTHVTAYPSGSKRPTTSSLNVSPGESIANLVVAKVGAGGKVRLYNHAGAIDLIADVTGYWM